MPQDNQDKKSAGAPPVMGRTYRGETSPPITTPGAAAEVRAKQDAHAKKPDAVSIQVYFVNKGIDNPIVQASMLAYTDVRIAPIEDFDEIFVEHHDVPAPKTAEEIKRP